MAYDEEEAEPITEPDTLNATKFYGYDASANYDTKHRLDGTERISDFYSRLAAYNTGVRNGKWGDNELLREQDNLALFDAIASQLELTSYQHSRGRQAFSELSLSELSSPHGIDATLCAVMVAAVVAREDGRMYHPSRPENTNDDLFTALLADLGYSDRLVHKCYGKVLNRVSL
ncbi:hypothetical protein JMJ58_19485 [Haloterrigena salifodinae]|uniref:Uncharacterized protein n=1 Tax=Haloterrigena salifodinae TaxID=2675099 RepID=A0A8T8DZP4_9EURY|nr:hypothetical protein [Haloterrigena salifodinae]QRV15064.1 hypothetical protein JMJ58_19485 [Haloterrigena salifodinae]